MRCAKGWSNYDRRRGGWRGAFGTSPPARPNGCRRCRRISGRRAGCRNGGWRWCWRCATPMRGSAGSSVPRTAVARRSRRPGLMYLQDLAWARPVRDGRMGGQPSRMSQVRQRRRRCVRRAEGDADAGGQGRAGAAGAGRTAPDAAGRGRGRRDGPADRPRAGDGRRLVLRTVLVQPRDAGACASPGRPSSPSSTSMRWNRACRRIPSCSTSRSR